jgi:hypothetical protein
MMMLLFLTWMVRGGAIRLPIKFQGEYMHILPDLPFKTPMEC